MASADGRNVSNGTLGSSIPVTLNIAPEDINQAISKAVLESSIGDAVRKAVVSFVTKKDRFTESPLVEAVHERLVEMVREEATKLVKSEHGDTLREHLRSAIDGQMVEALLKVWVEQMTDSLRCLRIP